MDTSVYLRHCDELPGAYAAGEITPSQVVDAIYALIESSDPGVWTAVIGLEELRRRAAELECRGMQGYPLYGIPFSVKDNINVAGLPTTTNSQYQALHPDHTAECVGRLIEAGAILIGKNTMDEFATGLVGTRAEQVPENPFGRTYVPGGSSSGSAVAVARQLVSFSLATDTGGSGRIPPALNNLIGYKPTPGKVSTDGLVYANRLFDCVPVFARSPRIISRIAAQLPQRKPTEASLFGTCAQPGALRRDKSGGPWRIGVPVAIQLEWFGDEPHRKAYESGLTWVSDSVGARLEELDLSDFFSAAHYVFGSSLTEERRNSILSFTGGDTSRLNPAVRSVVEGGNTRSAQDAFADLYELSNLQGKVQRMFEDVDIIATPTVPTIYSVQEVESDPLVKNHNMGYYTYPVNVLGLAAIAIPAGFRDDGLPLGLSLLGPQGSDDMLLRLLEQIPFSSLGAANGFSD